MSYLRHVCADKGHVCPSTAVEGTDAIRLYTCPCSNRTRLRGDRAAFYFTSNDSSKQALCPRTTRPYLARRFYRNVFCLSFVALDGTARTTDRWQLSVSRREKEEPIVVMIFFSSHLLFPTFEDRERIPILYIYTRPRDYLRAASELKKTRGLFLCPPSPFFSRSRRNSRGRNAETMLRIRFITYEIR